MDQIKRMVGSPPKLSPEQMQDVLDLVEARIKAESEIEKKMSEIKSLKQDIADLKDRKAALSNTQIGNAVGVSHNIVRSILLGRYRWQQVDSGHETPK